MKKTVSAVLALLLVLSLVQFAAATEMPDNNLPKGAEGEQTPPPGGDPAADGSWQPQEGQNDEGLPQHPGPMPPEGINPKEQEEELPGITPDHKFLWNLELALEKLDIAMTFSESEKAKKKLAHASERIAEAKAMVKSKLFDDAMNAQSEHDDILKDLEGILNKLKGENGSEELDDIKEIEEELEEHEEIVDEFKDEFKDKYLGIEGNLTPEQKAKLEALVDEFGASLEDIDIKVNAKKNRIIIKMTLAEHENDSEEQGSGQPLPDDQLPGNPGQMPEESEFLDEPEWMD